MLLNKSRFVEFCGVTRTAVYKAIKVGSIIVRKDGKIDTKHADNIAYVAKHNNGKEKQPDKNIFKSPSVLKKEQIKKKLENSPPKKKGKTKPVKKTPPSYKSPYPEDDNPDPNSKPLSKIDLDVDAISLNQVTILEKVENVKMRRIKTDKEREDLLPKDLVLSILDKLVSIDINELLSLGNNMASEIAGMLGYNGTEAILKVNKYVQGKCYKVIEHKQREIIKFLESIRVESKNEE